MEHQEDAVVIGDLRHEMADLRQLLAESVASRPAQTHATPTPQRLSSLPRPPPPAVPPRPPVTCYNCHMVGHTVNSCPFTRPPNNIRCHNCNNAGHLARNCRMTCGRCGQTGHRTAICQAPVPWPQFQRRVQQVAMRRDQRYQALARPLPPSRPAGELLRQINNGQKIRDRDEGQERRVPGGFSNSPRFVDNRMVVPGNFPQTGTRFSQNLNYNDLDEEVPPNMNYNNRVGHINFSEI